MEMNLRAILISYSQEFHQEGLKRVLAELMDSPNQVFLLSCCCLLEAMSQDVDFRLKNNLMTVLKPHGSLGDIEAGIRTWIFVLTNMDQNETSALHSGMTDLANRYVGQLHILSANGIDPNGLSTLIKLLSRFNSNN